MTTFGLPMGLVARKPVLGALDQTIPKQPVKLQRLAKHLTDTSFLVNLDLILSNKRISKVFIRLPGCASWSAPLLFPTPR